MLRLNFHPNKVARWETTGHGGGGGADNHPTALNGTRRRLKRDGIMAHWWRHMPTEKEDMDRPCFILTDLYFDTSDDRGAWTIATIAAERYELNPTL